MCGSTHDCNYMVNGSGVLATLTSINIKATSLGSQANTHAFSPSLHRKDSGNN